MKKSKGIFDGITETLAPGMTDKAKTVADIMIFQSGAMKNRDRDKQQNPEDMELLFKGISIPVDVPGKESLNKAVKGKILGAADEFQLPGFSKDDMAVDSGDFLEKGLGKSAMDKASKKMGGVLGGDMMDIEDKDKDKSASVDDDSRINNLFKL